MRRYGPVEYVQQSSMICSLEHVELAPGSRRISAAAMPIEESIVRKE
jgi:hypothetical protein